MLWNCLEENVCLYRPNARWGGEFERLKTLPRTTAGELQNIVESRGQKTLKTNVKQHLHHHMLFGRVSRKIILTHPKTTPAYSVIRHDWNFKWDWLLWSDETKTNCFLAETLKMCLVNTGIKSTPCVQWNILLYLWCCGPIFLLEVLDIFINTRHHGFYQIPTDTKINKWLILLEIL